MTLDGPVDAGGLAVDDVSWPHPNGAAAHASPTRLSTAILRKIPFKVCMSSQQFSSPSPRLLTPTWQRNQPGQSM